MFNLPLISGSIFSQRYSKSGSLFYKR